MIRLLVALLLLAPLAVVISDANAISATCLPGGFPATPTPPVFTKIVTGPFQVPVFSVDIWRLQCQDRSGQVALLLRATPFPPAPFICDNFTLIQGGQQIPAHLQQTVSDVFCDELLLPLTFSLERSSGPAFDNTAAFTLDIFWGIVHQTLEVPAGGATPELGITVVSTGCNPCSAGQTATFHVHVVNRAGGLAVELRAGIKFPNNGPQVAIFDLCTETILETGEQDIPLASFVVPGDVPNGIYTIEAAILDPIFGTTLSRHAINATKQ